MFRCEFCFELYDESIAMGVCPHCGYHHNYKPKDPRYLPIGTLINERYVVGGVIGDGGFGITYRAWDTKLNACMALKEYYQRGVVNRIPGTTDVFIAAPDRAEEFYYGRDRLLREARIVSKFQTSVVVRVNDYFEENGTSYMVMEYLGFPTLTNQMIEQKHPMTVSEVYSIGSQLCEALQEIHAAGVIHRDIAPDNIFISDEGNIKVIDFGSARLSQQDVVERLILVKEGFSPIEQYEAIDLKQDLQKGWTDIYAVGATLYYCLTGIRPEESRIRKAKVDEGKPDIKEPKELNPNVDENLNNIIMKAMAINQHERFKTAEEMLTALQGNVKVLPLPVVRKRKKAIRAVSIGGGLLAAILIIIATSIHGKIVWDEIVLDAADITVWYSISENDTSDSKTSVLEQIRTIEAESPQFEKVTIELKGFPESEYEDQLEKAYKNEEMPTLFECVDADAEYMEDVCDVSTIIQNLDGDTRSCWFVEDYKTEFSRSGCIPTGFEVPVIYINSTMVTDYTEETSISSMEDLISLADEQMLYKPIAVDPSVAGVFAHMFSDYDEIIDKMTVLDEQAFLDSKAAVYLSTTSKLTEAQQLGSSCKIAKVDAKNTECLFRNYWSISECSEEKQAAAQVLLAYFYTDNAQDIFYLQAETKTSLPLNKTILSQYKDVYWQLNDIVDDCERFTFE